MDKYVQRYVTMGGLTYTLAVPIPPAAAGAPSAPSAQAAAPASAAYLHCPYTGCGRLLNNAGNLANHTAKHARKGDVLPAISDDTQGIQLKLSFNAVAPSSASTFSLTKPSQSSSTSSTSTSSTSSLTQSSSSSSLTAAAHVNPFIVPAPTFEGQQVIPHQRRDGRSKNRGAEHRRSLPIKKKLQIIDRVKELHIMGKGAHGQVGREFGVARSLVTKYIKMEPFFRSQLTTAKGKRKRVVPQSHRLRGPIREGRHPGCERMLYDKMKALRCTGRMVTGEWLKAEMSRLVATHSLDAGWRSSSKWLARFVQRYKITYRRRTNANAPTVNRLPKLRRFHYRLLCRLAMPHPQQDAHSRWRMSNRYNVDQVPCVFGSQSNKTWHLEEDGDRVTISAGATPDAKREATLQICVRFVQPGELQVRGAIVFRGQGLRISAEEKMGWSPKIDVYFQPKAWMDTALCLKWITRTFAPLVTSVNAGEESVLFMDNLSSQKAPSVKEALWEEARTKPHFLPAGQSDTVQVVDQGIGKMVKSFMGKCHTQWLQGEGVLEKWCRGEVTTSQRRVLLTQWFGDALDHVHNKFNIVKSAVQTGLGLYGDGTNRHEIKLQGVTGAYEFGRGDAGSDIECSADEAEEVSDHALSDVDSCGNPADAAMECIIEDVDDEDADSCGNPVYHDDDDDLSDTNLSNCSFKGLTVNIESDWDYD